jgi:hypothetical protein
MSETTPHYSAFRLVFGLGLIAGGVLYTLSNLGMIDSEVLTQWWPTLIILYGLLRLIGLWCRRAWLSGSIIILFGTWWLLHNLGLVPFDILQMWPLIFIFMGIGIMRRGRWGRAIAGIGYIGVSRSGWRARRRAFADAVAAGTGSTGTGPQAAAGGEAGAPATGQAAGASTPSGEADSPGRAETFRRWSGMRGHGETAEGVLRVDAFMSTVSRAVSSQQFRGGDVAAIMGGIEIDMRGARMADATARLEANLVMGGLTLIVPPDWVVEFQGTPIMGGVDDQSRRPAGETRGRLMITGVVLLSGILIKN